MKLRKYLFLMALVALFSGCKNSGGDDIVVNQIEILTQSPYTVSGDEGVFEVAFNVKAAWTAEVENGEGWCAVEKGSGVAGDNLSLRLNLTQNDTGKARSAGIKVRSEGKSASLIITQQEVTKVEILTGDAYTIDGAGGEVIVEFSSTKSWSAEVSESWCALDATSGDEGENVVLTALVERNLGESRQAIITISSLEKEYTITIDQQQKITYTFEVGDYYPYPESPEEATGIVFSIENGGLNGKYISIAEGKDLAWSAAIHKFDANDPANGRLNMSKVKAIDAKFEAHDVFRWVDSLNNYPVNNIYLEDAKDVWYLPATDELVEVYANKDVINSAMEALSLAAFVEEYPYAYWTSTEGTEASAMLVHFGSGQSEYAHKLVGDCRLHRAIAEF